MEDYQEQDYEQGEREQKADEVLRTIIEESPELEKEFERSYALQKRDFDISILGERDFNNSPAWENPIVREGFEKKILTYNQKNDRGIILLPLEEEAYGPVKEIRPGNMVFFLLSPKERDSILRAASTYQRANKFESLWAALRKSGYKPESASPSFYDTVQEQEQDRENRLRYMGLNQKEFSKMREEKEKARKFWVEVFFKETKKTLDNI